MNLELQDVYEHYARTSISEMYRYVCTVVTKKINIVCSLNISSSVLHFTELFISTSYVAMDCGLWTVGSYMNYIIFTKQE